jgi:hypothetical protein
MTDNLLYGMEHRDTDEFTFQINRGGDKWVQETGTVTITFKDREFYSAQYPFAGTYSRNGWRILAEIEAEISRLERTFFKENQ